MPMTTQPDHSVIAQFSPLRLIVGLTPTLVVSGAIFGSMLNAYLGGTAGGASLRLMVAAPVVIAAAGAVFLYWATLLGLVLVRGIPGVAIDGNQLIAFTWRFARFPLESVTHIDTVQTGFRRRVAVRLTNGKSHVILTNLMKERAEDVADALSARVKVHQ